MVAGHHSSVKWSVSPGAWEDSQCRSFIVDQALMSPKGQKCVGCMDGPQGMI